MKKGQRPRQHIRRIHSNSGRTPTTINRGVKFRDMSSDANRRFNKLHKNPENYTIHNNKRYKVLYQGQADDCIIDTGKVRTWKSRIDGSISKEYYNPKTGGWELLKPKKDFDGDGVPNSKDCEPFNPNKQGKLHDLSIELLRKKEEFFEKRRENELKKLSDESDRLKEKFASMNARNSAKAKILAQKQAIIDETNREKEAIRKLREQNKKAKKLLFEQTTTGKVTKGVKDFATSKQTKKVLKDTSKFLKKTFF